MKEKYRCILLTIIYTIMTVYTSYTCVTIVPNNKWIQQSKNKDLPATSIVTAVSYKRTEEIIENTLLVYFSEFAKVYCSELAILLLRAAILLLRAYCYYFWGDSVVKVIGHFTQHTQQENTFCLIKTSEWTYYIYTNLHTGVNVEALVHACSL